MAQVDDGFDYTEEYGDENTPPSWFPGGHLPPDARRMGLTHHVPDGALLDFAGKLDATSRCTASRRGRCWSSSACRWSSPSCAC